jgi:hypothetical protein
MLRDGRYGGFNQRGSPVIWANTIRRVGMLAMATASAKSARVWA